MTRVTILGAGITGLAIASQLPRRYEITVVAKDLPGDPDSTDWASPWAGGIWMPIYGSSKPDQKIQLDAIAHLLRLAKTNPESSAKAMTMEEFMEYQPPEGDFWFKDHVPDFRVLDKKDLPKGVVFGMTYTSVVVTPHVILPWLRKQLEDSGVKFKRANVTALSDLDGMGHDILINATGVGTRLLKDVKDTEVIPIRSQTVLVRTNYDKILMRHGADYSVPFTYVIPRGDGTAILGGFRDYNETAPILNNTMKAGIFERVHQNLPHVFPADPAEFDIVRDVIGIHPWREVGIRVEREELNGQKVIHAAIKGGGYICSFGVSKIAADLVNDIHLEIRPSRL